MSDPDPRTVEAMRTTAVRHFLAELKPGKVYDIVKVDAGKHHIEVCVSPTGRSVRVHIDGTEVALAPDSETGEDRGSVAAALSAARTEIRALRDDPSFSVDYCAGLEHAARVLARRQTERQ